MERNRQAGSRFELVHELVERDAAWLLLGGISAFESGAGVAGVEACAGLRFDQLTQPELQGIGNERREPGGDQRHAPDRDPDEGRGRDQAPDDHLGPYAPLASAAAIHRDRSAVDRVGQLSVPDLEPCEYRAAGPAEAEHTRGRGYGFEIVVGPLAEK